MKQVTKFIIIQIIFLLSFSSSILAYNYDWSTHEDITLVDKPKECTLAFGCSEDGEEVGIVKPPNKSEPTCNALIGQVGGTKGSPVYVKSGFFNWDNTDITLLGKPSIILNRTYTAFEPHLGMFGNSWISSFEKIFLKTVKYSKDENAHRKSEIYFIYRGEKGGRFFYKYNENNNTFIDIGNFRAKAKRIDEHLATLTYPNGVIETYKDGYLIKRVDKLGNKLTLTYDDNYLLQEVSNGVAKLTFSYNSNGFVSQITDHTGRSWQYSYDENGNLISVKNPLSQTILTYEYKEFKFSNDAKIYYLITNIKDATNRSIINVAYDDKGRVSSYTTGTQTYSYYYNEEENIVYKSDINGNQITYKVDNNGYITKVIDPLNNQSYESYNEANRTTTFVDEMGNKWLRVQDEQERTIATIDPLGNKTQYKYSGDNPKPVKVISPKGYITTMTYDKNYNLLSVTDPKGNRVSMKYDNKGNLISTTDAKGATTQISYNSFSLPISIKDALGRVTTINYDKLGRKISQTDPAGKTTQFEYDKLDRLVKIINPLGHTIEYSYDNAGRLLKIKDPVGNETKYEYDEYGRLAKEIRPDGKETTYTYRNDNLIASINRFDGKKVTFEYDSKKRVTYQSVGNDAIYYSYNALNLITQTQNDTATIDYSYDAIGRVIKEKVNEVEITRAYDKESNLKTLTFLGKTISYTRDKLGLATTINNGINSFGFSYDKNSFLTQIALPNGINENYTFNKAGELIKISSITDITYEYDKRGLITKKTIGSDIFDYGYDDIGRLISENGYSFNYDKAGNNLNNNATYNTQNNQMVQSDKFAFEYDSAGNVVKKVDKTTNYTKLYTFNDRNQLIKVVTQDDSNQTVKTMEFSYDPVGRRYSKSVNGVEERFIYDGLDIVAITDTNNNIISNITHSEGIDQPLSISDGTNTYYYLRDHQGSIIALTDSSGTKVEEYKYNAYGEVTSKNSTANTHNPYGYTGRVMDDNDLYYYRARYYDPTTQRFISEDPIGFSSGDFNFYRYVGNSPVNFVDFLGYEECKEKKTFIDYLKDFLGLLKTVEPKVKYDLEKAGENMKKTTVNKLPLKISSKEAGVLSKTINISSTSIKTTLSKTAIKVSTSVANEAMNGLLYLSEDDNAVNFVKGLKLIINTNKRYENYNQLLSQ